MKNRGSPMISGVSGQPPPNIPTSFVVGVGKFKAVNVTDNDAVIKLFQEIMQDNESQNFSGILKAAFPGDSETQQKVLDTVDLYLEDELDEALDSHTEQIFFQNTHNTGRDLVHFVYNKIAFADDDAKEEILQSFAAFTQSITGQDLVLDLRSAVENRDAAAARKCLKNVQASSLNKQELLELLFSKIEDRKWIIAQEQYPDLFKQLKNIKDPNTFTAKARELFAQELSDTASFERLFAIYDVLLHLPGEAEDKQLSTLESLTLALFIEMKHEALTKQELPSYVAAKQAEIARSLIFDPKSHSVIILSKKASLEQGRGAEKKASNATWLTMTPNPPNILPGVDFSIQSRIRLVNWTREVPKSMQAGKKTAKKISESSRQMRALGLQPGKNLSFVVKPVETIQVGKKAAERLVDEIKKEMKLAQRFSGGVYLVVEHTSSFGKAKVNVIVEPYKHSLQGLFTSDSVDKQVKLDKVFYSVAQQLKTIHDQGYAYFDLQGENIRYNDKGKVTLIDFGLCHNCKKDYPNKVDRGYGQPGFSSPESIDATIPNFSDPIQQSQAQDMYAFGCLYYQKIFDHLPACCQDAQQVAKSLESSDSPEQRAREVKLVGEQRQEYDTLNTQLETCTDPKKQKELEICLRLLDPNPLTRMSASELATELATELLHE